MRVVIAPYNDVDRQNKLLRIPATNTKSKKARTVPLNDSAMNVLDQLELFYLNNKFEVITSNVLLMS